MDYSTLPLAKFANRHSGETAVIVGRGPTRFDYRELRDFSGPVLFLNDAVQFDCHTSGPSYLFAVDKPMVRLLQRNFKALPVLPRDLEELIRQEPVIGISARAILFYECERTPRELLLRLSREELVSLGEIYNGSATILSALHFLWFCNCAGVIFIGCDGINDVATLQRIGDPIHGYDRRLHNISKSAPQWRYARIREEQDRFCRQLKLDVQYVGTPELPHPNRFHRAEPQIPAVAHYVWLGGPLPEFMRSNMDRFRKLHPNWEVCLWLGVPERLSDKLRQMCLCLHQLCMRSDLIRIWLLHEIGGVYLDGDVFPIRPFDELRHFSHFFATEQQRKVATNCVVGATPRSDFTEKLMARVQSILSRNEPPSVRTALGPRLFTRLMREYPGLVNPLPEHYFCLFQDHDFAFPLCQKHFPDVHRTLVSRESDMVDGVWPYGIHTYGIPANQLPFAARLSSWNCALGRADALLRRLPSCPVAGVEVGVADGKMSSYLLGHHPELTLIMVDRWVPPPDESSYTRSVDEKAWWSMERHEAARLNAALATEFAIARRQLLQAQSLDATKAVDDGSLDFAFIDADHSFESVTADIAAWLPKIKSGGWLGGHDYHGVEGIEWGVRRAVDGLIADSGWSLELDENDTWFVQVP